MKAENTVMRLYVHITLRYTVIRFSCFQDSFHLLLTAAVRRSVCVPHCVRVLEPNAENLVCRLRSLFVLHSSVILFCSFSAASALSLQLVYLLCMMSHAKRSCQLIYQTFNSKSKNASFKGGIHNNHQKLPLGGPGSLQARRNRSCK